MSAIGPGDWVECVDMNPRNGFVWEGDRVPVEGNVYQVSDAFIDGVGDAVLLFGWERCKASVMWGFRAGFNVKRFRPIHPGGKLFKLLMEPVDGLEDAPTSESVVTDA